MYRHLSKESIELEYKHLDEIVKVFPDLELKDINFKDDGLVYDILSVDKEFIFRFPKYDWAIEDMDKEAACLKIARRHTDIPIPDWKIHNHAFISYKRIEGVRLTTHEYEKFNADQRSSLARKLGNFLKSLHSIPKNELKADTITDSITSHTNDEWLKLYDDVQQELFPFMTISARDAVDTLFRVIIADYSFSEFKPAFINGELTDSHILFDAKKKKLTGIIDFGSAGIGDPATDIACLLLQYGETFVSRLMLHYPAIGDMIDRARFIAQTYPLQWALGGIRTGDYSWMLVHLGKRGSINPIGSPPACL